MSVLYNNMFLFSFAHNTTALELQYRRAWQCAATLAFLDEIPTFRRLLFYLLRILDMKEHKEIIFNANSVKQTQILC